MKPLTMPLISMLFLAAAVEFAHARRAEPMQKEHDAAGSATQACLAGQLPPLLPDEPCSPAWSAAGCLRSEVAAWGPSYQQVHACFRCCMVESLAPFAARRKFWSEQLLQYSRDPWARHSRTVGQQLGVEPADSVLLGALSPMLVADIGATYANGSLVAAGGSREEGGTLVVIHGWTLRSGQVLRTLWHRWPKLAKPVALLTMGDQPLPEVPSMHHANTRGLSTWWVHNAEGAERRHPKVALWPRGLKSTGGWASLLLRASARQTTRQRKNLLFCGCMSLASHPERRHKLSALRANGFPCTIGACSSEASRAGLLDARFTACPRGNGAQNHREWEALVAGSIPIVDYDAATEDLLWESTNLPVVRVQNWSTVTTEWLQNEWVELQARTHSWAPVYLPYWLDKLLGSVTSPKAVRRSVTSSRGRRLGYVTNLNPQYQHSAASESKVKARAASRVERGSRSPSWTSAVNTTRHMAPAAGAGKARARPAVDRASKLRNTKAATAALTMLYQQYGVMDHLRGPFSTTPRVAEELTGDAVMVEFRTGHNTAQVVAATLSNFRQLLPASFDMSLVFCDLCRHLPRAGNRQLLPELVLQAEPKLSRRGVLRTLPLEDIDRQARAWRCAFCSASQPLRSLLCPVP